MAEKKRMVPRYFGLRIYILSTVLYFFMVFPVAGILVFKYIPDYMKMSGIDSQLNGAILSDEPRKDTTDPLSDLRLSSPGMQTTEADTAAQDTTAAPFEREVELRTGNNRIGGTLSLLIRLLLISFLLGFLFNLPFKRYFRKKRKGVVVPPRLFNFCKRFLLKTPFINSAILGFSYGVTIVYMLYILFFVEAVDEVNRQFYVQFFFISLLAAILTLLFVYFWQKHRVHIKYLEQIFTEGELRKRIFNIKVGRIRNRLWSSSGMTTLLPLTIVIFYLLLSVTTVKELDIPELTPEHMEILLGKYQSLNLGIEIGSVQGLFYVNMVNSILMFIGIGTGIFIAFLYLLFFVRWTTEDIVYPVKELLKSMQKTGRGELDSYAVVRTNDEIGELTEGYNIMSAKIKQYIESISAINKANARFVPRQFLDFLGKESIADIKLGDQIQKEMTVLFTDIRNFTAISEAMSPKENFDFLNGYLGYMEPVIRNNHGFIDKYIGDSIMALFPGRAEDALNASIEMRIKLTEFNEIMAQFGKPAVNSGIGIHSGELMLGIVGGEGRMDGTVISDAVNLSSRIEGLTKVYGCSVIFTEDSLIRLGDPSHYQYRFLDVVKVKGKKEAVYIFELLDGNPDESREYKLKTKDQFGKAINLYKNKRFDEARKEFGNILRVYPEDRVAQIYAERIDHYKKEGVPKDWDGAEPIDHKF